MRATTFDALVQACAAVTHPGTDPATVARLVAWAVRPRRTFDALRRRARDEGVDDDLDRWIRQVTDSHLHSDEFAMAAQAAAAWQQHGCRLSVVGDPHYPTRLAHGWPQVDAPLLLISRGDIAAELPAVAIVGTRRVSGYGAGVTAWLSEAVASAGGRIVSGGAVGVDAAAHRAAVELPGGTTVVLGCGHAVDYPRSHARPGGLFNQVLDHGGAVASELFPYESPKAYHVRARNRIVAALADVVVVVEGGARSGALITAGAAAERDRTVLAVPGDVRAGGSAAPHRLLAEGVAPCTGPEDLLDAMAQVQLPPGAGRSAVVAPAPAATTSARLSVLDNDIHTVLAQAWPRPVRIDQLAAATGRNTASLLAVLTRARVSGELSDGIDGIRLRRPPDAQPR